MALFDFTTLFTPNAIAINWKENPSNREQYYLQNLFTPWKKQGLDLSWFKGSRGIGVSLMPTAFDAQITFRDREGFALTETEMPFFREGYKIKEKDRQELLKIRDLNDAYLNQFVDYIYDDLNNLIEGARIVKEREAAQLLFPANGNAGISFKANGVDYTYNYDPNGTWKAANYAALSGTRLWTAPTTSDPIADLETMKEAVYNNTGSEPTLVIMNGNTLNYMLQSQSIINRFKTFNNVTTPYLTKEELSAIVEKATGMTIFVYNKKYRDESKTAHGFVPDGYVSLIPTDAPLGRLAMGTTPEEADLRGKTDASVAIVDNGIAITQKVEAQPVNVNTWASLIALPTFERMDEVACIKVY